MNSFRLPGCAWILILFLLIGGPRVLGFLVFGFFFLVIIALIIVFTGTTILFRKFNINEYLNSQTEAHNKFCEYLVTFMILMAKADGIIEESELNIIRNFFKTHMRYSEIQMQWIEKLIKNAISKQDTNLSELCSEFNQSFGLHEKRILIQLLFVVANADGQVHHQEESLIKQIIQLLNLPFYEYESFKNMFRKSETQPDPFKILGLTETSSREEIKKRYRNLCKENHPDKVMHLGMEFKRTAEEKMTQINNAYEILKKQGRV